MTDQIERIGSRTFGDFDHDMAKIPLKVYVTKSFTAEMTEDVEMLADDHETAFNEIMDGILKKLKERAWMIQSKVYQDCEISNVTLLAPVPVFTHTAWMGCYVVGVN